MYAIINVSVQSTTANTFDIENIYVTGTSLMALGTQKVQCSAAIAVVANFTASTQYLPPAMFLAFLGFCPSVFLLTLACTHAQRGQSVCLCVCVCVCPCVCPLLFSVVAEALSVKLGHVGKQCVCLPQQESGEQQASEASETAAFSWQVSVR